MTYYGYIYNNINIINDKTFELNAMQFKYIDKMLITIDLKGLKTLNKILIWKAFYVLGLFLGKKPKLIHLSFEKAYKDTIYRVILFSYINKKIMLGFILNSVFLIRLAVEVWVYNYKFRYTLTFQTLTFIENFELNSELYDWRQPIDLHILFPEKSIPYKNMLLTALRIMPQD